MPRLPTPGGDNGNWGEILNEYLRVSLSPDGQLKPNSITQDHLQTDSVGRDQLAADSVTTYNLADASVTDDKLADGSVTSTKLASGAVTKASIGLDNVDNTSDVNKPISTAAQTALDTKVTGPSTAVTANALVRFDGTSGRLVRGSGITVDDSNNMGLSSGSVSIVNGPSLNRYNSQSRLSAASGTGLYITNSTGAGLYVSSAASGDIGLGTSSPTHSLTLSSLTSGITLYNTADQTGNYERVRQYWSNDVYVLGVESGGSGSNRPIRIGLASGTAYQFNSVGSVKHSFTGSSGINDAVITSIATSGSGLTAVSGTQLGLRLSATVTQGGSAGYSLLQMNVDESSVGSGERLLIDAQVSGVSRFKVASSGAVTIPGAVNGRDIASDGAKVDAIVGQSTPSVSTAGANFTIPITEGTSRITLSANTTATFSGTPGSTTTFVRTLVLIQAASGGPYTITWPVVEWASDANAPSMPTVANAEMIVHLYWTGAAWRGMFGGYFYP